MLQVQSPPKTDPEEVTQQAGGPSQAGSGLESPLQRLLQLALEESLQLSSPFSSSFPLSEGPLHHQQRVVLELWLADASSRLLLDPRRWLHLHESNE